MGRTIVHVAALVTLGVVAGMNLDTTSLAVVATTIGAIAGVERLRKNGRELPPKSDEPKDDDR